MRKILFRGKLKGTDEWVYGDLMRDNIHGEKTSIWKEMGPQVWRAYEVDPETVGQFTGYNFLKKPRYSGDCPLFDIYENSMGVSPKDDKLWACVFKDGGFRWQRVISDHHKHPSEYRWANEFCDIAADMYDCGTIHDCKFIEE